jgi:hypothetical protein
MNSPETTVHFFDFTGHGTRVAVHDSSVRPIAARALWCHNPPTRDFFMIRGNNSALPGV